MKKVYLAGPEVFKVDSIKIGKKLVKKCKKYNLKGLYPLDNIIEGTTKKELSKNIFLANKKMIEKADYVIANLNPFRSNTEPDSGTVWEVGYALGLGKKVYGYINNPNLQYIERIPSYEKFTFVGKMEGTVVDSDDMIIEDFENPLNLMITESVIICDSFKECLKRIKNESI